MSELESEIRIAVIERVDRAPMAPTIESIDSLDRAGLPAVRRQPSRGVLVGAALVALLALIAGVLVTSRLTRDPAQLSVGTTVAPPSKPATPLAGRSLPARYGLPNGVPGYRFFTMELDRPVGLAADDFTYLPSGPIGPVYAQNLRIDNDPTTFALPDVDGIAVLTVLPEEAASVIASATGGGPTHSATVEGHEVTVTDQWSGTDNRAVSWERDGAAIIVTGSPSVTEQQLLSAAAAVTPIPTVPLLPPVDPQVKGSGQVPASYSLAPRPGPASDPTGPITQGTPWDELTSWADPLAPAMGTLVIKGDDGGDHYTVRAIGDPATDRDPIGAPGFDTSSDAAPIGPMWMSLSVGETRPNLPNRFSVKGEAPTSVTTVHLVLDDGTTVEGPTYDAGRGWPGRSFMIFVPDDREVVHVDARSSDGTLLYTSDLEVVDGHHPGQAHGLGMADYSICGSTDPQPQFPTVDC